MPRSGENVVGAFNGLLSPTSGFGNMLVRLVIND